SGRYVGKPQPAVDENRSLTKYRLMIDEFGGWNEAQRLLAALSDVAQRHECSIGTVATAYVLSKPGVGSAIVGARNRAHLADATRLVGGEPHLTAADIGQL